MRIVFMGTPEFAVPSLNMLVLEGYDIVAVVTQPDKPKGRGKKLSMPEVKEVALKSNIKVLQPNKIKTEEFLMELKNLNPDLLVTVAYGKILSKEILDVPRYGCINVHGSLLPQYRGAAPIHWAIIHGEKKTGITTMFTDVGLDTGDILLKEEIEITDEMTTGKLHDEMAELGAEVLRKTLEELKSGNLKRIKQDDSKSTYAPIINKEIGKINWENNNANIYNLIRGTNPWPLSYTFYKNSKMRIWGAKLVNENHNQVSPGTIVDVSDKGMLVSTLDGCVLLTEIQFDSEKKMSVKDYIRGHEIDKGEKLE